MQAGHRRHLVGETLINVRCCDITYNTLCWQVNDHTDISLNKLIQFRLNNTPNLRPSTPQIIPYYTHKMAIVS